MISELKWVVPKTHSSCAWNLLTHRGGGRQHALWPSLGSLPTTIWLVSTFGSASHQGEEQLLGVASSCNPLTAGCQRGEQAVRKRQPNYSPIVHLKDGESCVLCQLLFLFFRRVRVLKEIKKKQGMWTAGNVYPILSITWVSSEVYN